MPSKEAIAYGIQIADALAAAREVDATITALPAETPFTAILGERPALLDRSIHRYEHLAALKGALNASRT